MGYRERRAAMIAERAAPHLQPGERIQTGFIAQTGHPLVIFVPILLLAARVWTIVATDRAFLIIGQGQGLRFRRDVVLGNPTRLYYPIQLDQKYWVHRDYYREVRAADEALRETQAQKAPGTHNNTETNAETKEQ